MLQSIPQVIIKNNLKDIQQKQHEVYNANADTDADKKLQPDNTPVLINNNLPVYGTMNAIAAIQLIIKEIPAIKSGYDLKRTGKIKWGIDFSIGGSSRFDRPFKVVSTEKAAVNTNGPVSVGTTNNVAGGVLVLPPSEVKPGAAFKIGVTINKPISKRIDISTSLRYAYTSDRITIGQSIYSSNSSSFTDRNYLANAVAQTSYSGMQPQNYTNKYHFVELPVAIYYNLNRKWKIPVILNAGAALSRLISSNVLLYDEALGGAYYQGKNNLSKTQFSVATGFAVRFTGNNQWQWSIGPQISMNTTKLFQSLSDKNKHPVFGGLNARILFPGKKR